MSETFTEQNPTGKTYLGDGAFAHFDGYHIVLTTSDGIRTTNEAGPRAVEGEFLEGLDVEKLRDHRTTRQGEGA